MPRDTRARAPIRHHPRWAYLAEAEAYSGVPRRTLRRWIAEGRLPGERVGPRRIQVDLNDLDRLREPIPAAEPLSPTG